MVPGITNLAEKGRVTLQNFGLMQPLNPLQMSFKCIKLDVNQ